VVCPGAYGMFLRRNSKRWLPGSHTENEAQMNVLTMTHRFLFVAICCCCAQLSLTGQAQGSWYTCSASADLHAVDESASTCRALESNGGALHWPEGTTLAFTGGECEECPTVAPCPEDNPDCNADACSEYLPTVHVSRDGAEVEATWSEETGAPCGWSRHLTTALEPGVYEVSADNGDHTWVWSVRLGPDTDAAAGCSSQGGEQGAPTSLIPAILILAAMAARTARRA